MLKAVFLDYCGTVIREKCEYTLAFAKRVIENSTMEGIPEAFAYWWKNVNELELQSFGESYITEDEIVDIVLDRMDEEIGLSENHAELHELCRLFWTKAPVFDDVGPFFENCPVPVYIVTNNHEKYVSVALNDNGLKPAGIIYGDLVRAYKPRRELFLRALETAGCKANEAVHIGDSMKTDVAGAAAAGIKPIFLNREKKPVDSGVAAADTLLDALSLIGEML